MRDQGSSRNEGNEGRAGVADDDSEQDDSTIAISIASL